MSVLAFSFLSLLLVSVLNYRLGRRAERIDATEVYKIEVEAGIAAGVEAELKKRTAGLEQAEIVKGAALAAIVAAQAEGKLTEQQAARTLGFSLPNYRAKRHVVFEAADTLRQGVA